MTENSEIISQNYNGLKSSRLCHLPASNRLRDQSSLLKKSLCYIQVLNVFLKKCYEVIHNRRKVLNATTVRRKLVFPGSYSELTETCCVQRAKASSADRKDPNS